MVFRRREGVGTLGPLIASSTPNNTILGSRSSTIPLLAFTMDKAYNSAKARHQEHADWPELGWYDFMTKVMKDEPVAVRGALGFGLKAVATAFHSLGLIKTDWADSPIDGLGAMVGAWRCDEEAKEQAVPMGQLPLMNEIAHYNEVDCKVMMEIVCYLRASH